MTNEIDLEIAGKSVFYFGVIDDVSVLTIFGCRIIERVGDIYRMFGKVNIVFKKQLFPFLSQKMVKDWIKIKDD